MIVDDAPVNCKMILRTLQLCQICAIEDAVMMHDGRNAVQMIRDCLQEQSRQKQHPQEATISDSCARRVRKSRGGGSESKNNDTCAISSTQNKPLPQVIFMDYFMFYLNGPDVVRQIRQLGYSGLIIGVTATRCLMTFVTSWNVESTRC